MSAVNTRVPLAPQSDAARVRVAVWVLLLKFDADNVSVWTNSPSMYSRTASPTCAKLVLKLSATPVELSAALTTLSAATLPKNLTLGLMSNGKPAPGLVTISLGDTVTLPEFPAVSRTPVNVNGVDRLLPKVAPAASVTVQFLA